MKIKRGEALPDAKVFILEKDPKQISIKEIVGDNKVILFGLPGAFGSARRKFRLVVKKIKKLWIIILGRRNYSCLWR